MNLPFICICYQSFECPRKYNLHCKEKSSFKPPKLRPNSALSFSQQSQSPISQLARINSKLWRTLLPTKNKTPSTESTLATPHVPDKSLAFSLIAEFLDLPALAAFPRFQNSKPPSLEASNPRGASAGFAKRSQFHRCS